jgi:hypothetical protein
MRPEFNSFPSTISHSSRSPGFALVVTLSLMILLTVIAVGLLTLSSISLRSSASGSAMQQARSNARLALMLALGELQNGLGPDQRISASGGQQLKDGDKSGGNHWTGVYDSWPATEMTRPKSPAFRRWLISGDDKVVTDPAAPKNSAPAAKKVALVAADANNNAVEAGLINVPTGACAWWVGDQNAKAKLGGAVEPAADAKMAAARMQAAPRAAHEPFLGNAVKSDDPTLNRLISLKTVDLVAKPAKPLFHDATTDALGLLTNVRSGGFRKDLNFLMEKPQTDAPKTPLYTAGSRPGINLGELWLDHNVWAEVAYPSSPPAHPDGGSFPSGSPFMIGLSDPVSAKKDPFLSYRHVTKLQVTLLFSLVSEVRNTFVNGVAKPNYELFLVADPIFTIWNPFNVSIQIPKSAYATFKTWAIPYDLNLTLKGGPGGEKKIQKSILDIVGKSQFFYAELGRVQDLVLRPGEVQVLSQGFNEPIRLPGTNGGYFDAKLGWDFGSGYKYPIAYETDPLKKDGSHRLSYSMSANATKGTAGLFLSSYSLGKTDFPGSPTVHIGSFNIDLLYTRLAGSSPIAASSFPGIFPVLAYDPSAEKAIKELEGPTKKWPICVFTYGLRTEMDPIFESCPTPGTRYTGRAMMRTNPTSLAHDMFNLNADIVRASPLQIGMRRVNSLSSPIVECDSKGLGYFGAEYGASNGVSYVVTRSVPLEPVHSIGALQHSCADGTPFGSTRNESMNYLLPSVSHPIANSFAPSILKPEDVRGKIGGRDVADHSYLANQALWDTYFHSSITPRSTSANKNSGTAYSEQKERLEEFLATNSANFKPLPNERMRPWSADPKDTLSAIFPSNNPAPDAADRIAAHLMVDGMFNVNSTSVAAWKAVLSGLRDAEIPVRDTPNLSKDAKLTKAKNTPVAGLLAPCAGEIDESGLGDPASPLQWRGFRSLSEAQIEELAKAIVKQVRLRGPFLSIADFVNRRPGSDKDLALSGPLQSALDDKVVSINAEFRQGERSLGMADASAQGFAFPEAEAGAKAVGAPGYVKQGDLLTTLGPLITVRGDTFVIRAYGETRDASGKTVLARAWCEATVQRVPDYLDPSDMAHDPAPKSKANLNFGRRFDIVSFRFLHPREIS